MKKILYVINHMDWFWSHRLPLAQGAKARGYHVIVAATGASQDTKLKEMGFEGAELPAADQGFGPAQLLKIICAISVLLAKHKPDIMHAITIKYAFLAGLAARLHSKTRPVFTIAGLGYLFSGEGLKPKILRTLITPYLWYALRHKKGEVIFQNPDDRDIMVSRGFARTAQTHLILGSGVDISAFDSAEEPDDSTQPVVVMPTRLVHDKGVAVFVEAARLLKERGMDARFQIAGGLTAHNPLAISKDEMEEMVKDGATEWLGKIEDMPALLQSAHVIAYPSYYREGIPKVLLEACAIGRAIVTTDHPGCREAVHHGENGLLVPIKDPQTTANAIELLLKDGTKRKAMAAQSRKRAENAFDVNLIVDQTLKVYDFALQS